MKEDEYKKYQASLNAYRDIKNSVDWAEEKGKKEGEISKAERVVIRMHELGYSLEEIADVTELPVDEVEMIIKKNGKK